MRMILAVMTNARRAAQSRTALVLCGMAFGAIASTAPALAAWEENGRTILTVAEVLPMLTAALGTTAQSDVKPSTPVLCDADAIGGDSKALQAALLQSGLRFDRLTSTVRDAHPTSERARAERRLLAAAPFDVSPDDPQGIPTGCVALFGQLVAPPYRLELVRDVIELNGVAIFPVPGEPVPAPQVTEVHVQTHNLLSAAMERYQSRRGTPEEADARNALLADLRAVPGVSEASWLGPDDVSMTRNGSQEYVTFGDERESSPGDDAARTEVLNSQLASLRDVLVQDGTLLCGASYLIPVWEPAASAFRPRLEAITRSSEAEALRIARLQAYTLDRAAAADLIFAR
jgi:hypothetical protein